jgi:hypothetical protein
MSTTTLDPIDILSTGIQPPDELTGDCMICQESLADGQTHRLECGHCYHTTCVIAWFRTGIGTCPYCKDTGVSGGSSRRSRPGHRKLANFRSMISHSRRKDAPDSLVRLVKELRTAEASLEAKRKEADAFESTPHPEMTFSSAGTTYRRLRRAYWRQYSDVAAIKRRIDSYPIIPLIIPKFVRTNPQSYPS